MDPGPGDSPQDDIGRLFAARQEFDAQAQRFEPARGRADLTGAMAELAQVPGLARFRAAESPEIGAAIGTADRMRRARVSAGWTPGCCRTQPAHAGGCGVPWS